MRARARGRREHRSPLRASARSRPETCCRRARCWFATARLVFRRTEDVEGFRAGQAQFDSDITDGRYPRAALGLADGKLFAVACDGRSRFDAGLTLEELAALMAALGCSDALNLDGGGSTSLVSGGRLRNRPRGSWERPEVGGRPVSTALLFLPRVALAPANCGGEGRCRLRPASATPGRGGVDRLSGRGAQPGEAAAETSTMRKPAKEPFRGMSEVARGSGMFTAWQLLVHILAAS